MKILFIQPRNERNLSNLGKAVNNISGTPYMSIQQLIAATPKEHTVELIDERFENINFEEKFDLVAIMKCFTIYALRSYEIADNFRKKGIPVILSGDHPTAFPDEAKQHADSIVIGEQEGIWKTVLKDAERKQLNSYYKAEKYLEPENIPPHRCDIGRFPIPSGRVEIARGCPQACDFCMHPVLYGTNYRLRPFENIMEEIRNIKQRNILFTEPSLTLAPELTKRIFKEMKSLNKRFICYGHTDILSKDEDLLKLSSEAGCLAWWIDFESLSQETINYINKKHNKIEEYASCINKIHEYSIAAVGTLIFGLDTDTLDIFDKTQDALNKWEIDAVEVNTVCPFPGTPLFKRLDAEGRILTRDWSKYNEWNIVYQPKHMTPEELLENSIRVAREFYSYPNFLKRIIRSLKLRFPSFLYTFTQNYLERRFYNSKF
ncbi:MAG TPA: radical SAM protein [Candidatus Lokiarchaeia archaeon]